jgi:hypothetical protein
MAGVAVMLKKASAASAETGEDIVKVAAALTALVIAATSAVALASEETGPDPIPVTYVLCAASGYCNAYFPPGTIPMHTCTRTTGDAVRWQVTTPAGAAMLSLVQAAKLSGTKVKVSVDGCISEYPKLNFIQLL